MDTVPLTVDKATAREAWRQYHKDRAYSKPMDWEIARIYQLIAQGKTIIRALASIVAAGLKPDGYPKLAIARADARGRGLSAASPARRPATEATPAER